MLDSVTHDVDAGLIRVRIVGTFVVDDYRAAMVDVSRLRGIAPQVHSIWDLSDVDFSEVDIELIRGLSSARLDFMAQRQDVKIAVIVPGLVEKAMIKLFFDLAESPGTLQRVFTDLGEAQAWCREGR